MSKNSFAGRSAGKNSEAIKDPAALSAEREAAQAAEAEKKKAAEEEATKVKAAEEAAAATAPAADLPAGEENKEVANKIAENAAASVALPEIPVAQPEVHVTAPPAVVPEPVAAPTAEIAVTSPPPMRTRINMQRAVAAQREASPEIKIDPLHKASMGFTAMMQKEQREGTPTAKRLINFLEDYVARMAPRRPMRADEILKYQESLFSKLVEVVEDAPSLEFDRLWGICVAYFTEYQTHCFSPVYATRGSREWSRPIDQFELFTQLLNLLMATASGRSEDVKLEDSFRGLSREGRGRITIYYSNRNRR